MHNLQQVEGFHSMIDTTIKYLNATKRTKWDFL